MDVQCPKEGHEMDLNERKLQILQAIIGDFIHYAEPVGSRTLSKKYDMGISPATIRNEMSDLEDMGFLTHPHTSAGRVPSTKAYRLYVDALMERSELSVDVKKAIAERLNRNVSELEHLIRQTASVLSEITNLTSFAMTPKTDEDRLKYIRFIPVDPESVILMIVAESGKVSNMTLRLKESYSEENLDLLSKVMTYSYKGKTISEALTYDILQEAQKEARALGRMAETIMPNFLKTLEEMLNVQLYLDGLTNIFNTPEYNDVCKAKSFFEMLERKDDFTKKLVNRGNGVIITIGDEHEDELMKNCSLITATYHIDGKLVGRLGVIGPTRMKYDEVTSVIEYLTENLENSFRLTGEGETNE
jgi:heat-inducible transcriptional repressor